METSAIQGSMPVPIRKGRIRDEGGGKGQRFQDTLSREGQQEPEEQTGEDSEGPIARLLQERQRRTRRDLSEGEHQLDVMA